MSLIVLNSKGDDPEMFSNYVTEQIKFPRNAQVCLVGSHINRKLLVDADVIIPAGANTLALQLGTAANPGVANVRNDADYTPHQPILYDFSNELKTFPLVLTSAASAEALLNRVMNDYTQTPISPLVGGWISEIANIGAAVAPTLAFKNQMKVPSAASALGSTTTNSIVEQPGQNTLGGINTTTGLDGTASIQGVGAFANWVKVRSGIGHGNFIDKTPLWNTDNGQAQSTFTPAAGGLGIEGGGYNWQFDVGLATENEEIEGLRGGIFGDRGFATQDGQEQSTYTDTNPLTGGTKFDIWWEITRFTLATGAMEIGFFQRPRSDDPQFNSINLYKWGSIRIPPTGESVRISMRPVKLTAVVGSPMAYGIEAYGAVVTSATNLIPGAILDATGGGAFPGICRITDPFAVQEAPSALDSQQIDLYRHLPIRQGISIQSQSGVVAVHMNAIHHGDVSIDMRTAEQTLHKPYTFAFNKSLNFNFSGLDSSFYEAQQRTTIGTSLGFSAITKQTTAALMRTDGVAADFPVGMVVPMNHTLVVSLPDLPVSGFFGNSSGSLAAGTLNINSGGNSAPIIGAIPFGELPIRQTSFSDPTVPIDGVEQLLSGRGKYWSASIENWIDLNNPTPFSLSSLTVKITDELGNKPLCLEPNTTIIIKIRGRKEQRQGGIPGVI